MPLLQSPDFRLMLLQFRGDLRFKPLQQLRDLRLMPLLQFRGDLRFKPLQQLRNLDQNSPQFHEHLSNCFRRNEFRSAVSSLQGEDLALFVEYLNDVLIGISDHSSLAFRECLYELRYICGVKGVLPNSCTLPGLLPDDGLPPTSGHVYEGTLDGSKVRIQRIRICPGRDPQKAKETFHQVAAVWRYLAHSNIVPLLGVTIDPPQLVSDWMYDGDLTEYIASHPDADRLSLLLDVAEGLNYLHSCNVVHGDLKGSNILVDPTGCARITNLGLAMVTLSLDLIWNTSDEHGHSVRWVAPEISNNRGTYSKEGDVFSFAMVTIETFTGAVPLSDKPPHAAMLAIVRGERPPRPTDPTLTERLWELTQRCWDQEACRRPQMLEIVYSLVIPAWERLINQPFTTDERVSLITKIFSDLYETEVVKRLCGDDAQSFVDVIDETLDALPLSLRKKCLSTLCKICGRQALLPRSVQIPLCHNRSDTPLYRGGYADVWKGEHQGRKVAVKVLVVYMTSNLDKITHMFCKEVIMWRTLRHRNVLPLLGVTMSTSQFTMASEWMDNGNVNEFIKAHRDVDRFELLRDLARGLAYMHGEGMVHGDLKGANILVDRHGHARLADFGFTVIVSDSTYHTTSTSSPSGGTTRWMSPERLDPNRFGLGDDQPTKQSDCYALGMVILEVLSGQIPFNGDSNNFIVMQKVLDGKHPGRPRGAEAVWFTGDLWGMLEQCWSWQKKDRPTAEDVLGRLKIFGPRAHWKKVRSVISTLSVDGPKANLEKFTSFRTRYYRSDTGKQSQVWLRSKIDEITSESASSSLKKRIATIEFPHAWDQSSIITRINGTIPLGDVIIISAHQDSINMFPFLPAPGANGGGSGTVAILEAYRALLESDFKPNRTIEFHWYSAGEVGFLGSKAVAKDYKARGVKVVAVSHFDMTAWVKRGTREEVGVVTDSADEELTQFNKGLIEEYLSIPYVETLCGYPCSDHASWEEAGYPASFTIGSSFANSNHHIHTANDRIDISDEFSFSHLLEFSKIAVAFAIELGGVLTH